MIYKETFIKQIINYSTINNLIKEQINKIIKLNIRYQKEDINI